MGYYQLPEEDPLFPKNLSGFDANAAGPRIGGNNNQISYKWPSWFGTEGKPGGWYPNQPIHSDMYPPSFFEDRSFLQSPRFQLSPEDLNSILNEAADAGLTGDINDARNKGLWNPKEPGRTKERFSDIVRDALNKSKNVSPEELARGNWINNEIWKHLIDPDTGQFKEGWYDGYNSREEWLAGNGHPPDGYPINKKGLPGDLDLGKYGSDYDMGDASGPTRTKLGPASFAQTALRGIEHPAVQMAAIVPDAYRRGSLYNETADRSTVGGASYGTRVMNNLYGFGDAFNDGVTFGLYDYINQGPEASPQLKSIRDSFESSVMRILSDAETKNTPSSSGRMPSR